MGSSEELGILLEGPSGISAPLALSSEASLCIKESNLSAFRSTSEATELSVAMVCSATMDLLERYFLPVETGLEEVVLGSGLAVAKEI